VDSNSQQNEISVLTVLPATMGNSLISDKQYLSDNKDPVNLYN